MKNKKLLVVLGTTALVANLGYTSLLMTANAQDATTTGSATVSCTGATQIVDVPAEFAFPDTPASSTDTEVRTFLDNAVDAEAATFYFCTENDTSLNLKATTTFTAEINEIPWENFSVQITNDLECKSGTTCRNTTIASEVEAQTYFESPVYSDITLYSLADGEYGSFEYATSQYDNIEFFLNIPGNTPPGGYSGTLTFSLDAV